VNKILPAKVFEVESTEDGAYAYSTLEDALARIKQLEIELAEAQIAADGDAKATEAEMELLRTGYNGQNSSDVLCGFLQFVQQSGERLGEHGRF
jgi:4-alpha-glucanotransferase